jgi:hypothetical protein
MPTKQSHLSVETQDGTWRYGLTRKPNSPPDPIGWTGYDKYRRRVIGQPTLSNIGTMALGVPAIWFNHLRRSPAAYNLSWLHDVFVPLLGQHRRLDWTSRARSMTSRTRRNVAAGIAKLDQTDNPCHQGMCSAATCLPLGEDADLTP